MSLNTLKNLALRWVVPLAMVAALISVWVHDFRTPAIAANVIVVANAFIVSNWFMNRRDGLPAHYGFSRVDPDDDEEDVVGAEWLMLANAFLTVLAPFYLILV